VRAVRQKASQLPCGIIAAKYRPHPYWDLMPAWMRYGMGYLATGLVAAPQFIAYAAADLPALAPSLARRVFRMPLLAWTVRSGSERRHATRWADQIIFEGFKPVRIAAKAASEQRAQTMTELRISITEKIAGIAAAEWDACANPQPADARLADRASNGRQDTIGSAGSKSEACAYNPFVAHAFLSALEQSKSVGPRSGWQPHHVLAHTTDGALVAAVPCYLKSHSRGEYVFDHGWADAYARAGGSYYPKLQVAVPFTPATGRRLLVRPGPQENEIARALAGGLVEICKISGASGVHVTFAPEAEFRLLGDLGYLQRTDQQFHWENSGFSSFDNFLSALTARKRKTIRRERHDALANGISVHWITGSDLTEAVWDAFFEFYM